MDSHSSATQGAGGTVLPWPEETPPPDVDTEAWCAIVRGRRFVWAEGHPRGPVTYVLDNPGLREDKDGRPFACGTRLTLYRALKEARVPPDAVYLTFLVKCRPRAAYDREAAYAAYRPLLLRQVKEKQPRLLVLAGNTVVQALLGGEASAKGLRGRWVEWEGFPVRVTYHPLAALRRPNLFPLIVEDLEAVAAALIEPARAPRPGGGR